MRNSMLDGRPFDKRMEYGVLKYRAFSVGQDCLKGRVAISCGAVLDKQCIDDDLHIRNSALPSLTHL